MRMLDMVVVQDGDIYQWWCHDKVHVVTTS